MKLNLDTARELHEPENWIQKYSTFANGIDDIEPECTDWLMVPTGKKVDTLAFYDANDNDLTTFATTKEYFRQAARHTFIRYWPKTNDAKEAKAFVATSVEETRDELVARAAQIIDAATTTDLVDWLENRANVLFTK